jgi:hypothetical protein
MMLDPTRVGVRNPLVQSVLAPMEVVTWSSSFVAGAVADSPWPP